MMKKYLLLVGICLLSLTGCRLLQERTFTENAIMLRYNATDWADGEFSPMGPDIELHGLRHRSLTQCTVLARYGGWDTERNIEKTSETLTLGTTTFTKLSITNSNGELLSVNYSTEGWSGDFYIDAGTESASCLQAVEALLGTFEFVPAVG